MCYKNLKGFTMAEVLITIGVIGIVIAMTLPGVIKNYQRKVLETQFKKTVSVLSQVILKSKVKLGTENFAQYCTEYNGSYYLSKECYDIFYSNLANLDGKKTNYQMYSINRSNEIIKTYNNSQIVTCSTLAAMCSPIFTPRIMLDGSFISMTINEHYFYIGVDVNGLKGPNQLGHDIFIFTIDTKNDTLTYREKPKNYTDEEIDNGNYAAEHQKERAGNPCNFTSSQKANGIGCAWYALRDICPDGSNKGYFECLP